MSVSVRTARPEELGTLAHLLDEVIVLHHHQDPTQFREPGSIAHAQYLEERIQDQDAAIFVAEVKGALAGIAVAVIRDAPPFLNPDRFVLLENLVVTATLRRAGVGRKLVAAAGVWARARSIEELDLNVYEFNHSAIRFYEALGFQTVSRRMKQALPPIVETKH